MKLESFHYDETTNIFICYAKRHALVSKKKGETLKQAWLEGLRLGVTSTRCAFLWVFIVFLPGPEKGMKFIYQKGKTEAHDGGIFCGVDDHACGKLLQKPREQKISLVLLRNKRFLNYDYSQLKMYSRFFFLIFFSKSYDSFQ
jgi:hypothetical protein